MAHAAVISLKQTIERLLNSPRFSLVSSTRDSLESAYEEATSLQRVLKRLDDHGSRGGKMLDTLDDQIREAANKLEDFLELHQSDLFLDILSQYRDDVSSSITLFLDSEQVRQEMGWFTETARKLGEDYTAESDKPPPNEEGEGGGGGASSSNTGSGADMVGYSDELSAMKSHVTQAVRPDDWAVASIFGRPGTGRSYVAWEVFQYAREQCFDCCVWATVGPNYHRKAILLGILARILNIANGDRGGDGKAVAIEQDGMLFEVSDEEYVRPSVYSILVGRRYMIVLDDVRDTEILGYLLMVFPVQNNGSVVLVTTSVTDVRDYRGLIFRYSMEDSALQYEDIWWDLLRWLLFKWHPVSPELEETGRKLVRNCGGRYVCFVKLILFLWNADRTPEAWNQIADDQRHPIFKDIVDEISEIRKIKEDFTNSSIEPASEKAALSPFIEDAGISVDIKFIKNKLFPERFFAKMEVISFVGMAGIGKTAFVVKVFEYLQNLHHFDHCVWVTLGPKYKSEDIFRDIVAQIYPEIKEDVELAGDLSIRLSNQRFLIVLDDVWSEEPLQYLAESFPNIKGRALVTSRITKVAHSAKVDMVREMRLLSKEESWTLLCQKVFGEGLCPPKLEKSGKKIAENCDGLPLTIVMVASLISRDLSPQYWNDVANKNPAFMSALKELSNTLVPIYKSLPHYLKLCFLYMGIFSENYEVSTSKILKLWIGEGFLEPNPSQRVEDFAAQCLLELVDRNLVMVCQKGSDYGVKTCRLNSVLWHLSNSEAVKNNFFHALTTSDAIKGLKKQRRFCIRNCILLSIKEVYGAMMDSVPTAHSLLCTGTYHRYPVPVCLELRLLRVLDTLAIRLYDFPIEVVKLIHLRYLAITCDANLPTTISKLWNLEFLMISRHLRVRSSGDSSYLPKEIWDMKELRHLQVTGSNLPSPTGGTVLPNLETLLDVSYQTCTEEVLKGIPNLKRLGIQIEMAPDDAPPFHHLYRISGLSKLESLKCVVVNPEVVVPPAPHLSMFPSCLKNLSLSGLGYPWEYMDIIGQLKDLKVLNLRGYAFQGHKWETGDNTFKKLEHLVIEDTDLVCWKTTIFSFSMLKHLSIKHCYKLEEFPSNVFLKADTVEVVDCNPLAANWEELIRERNGSVALRAANEKDVKIRVEFCWEAANLKKFKSS